MYCSSLMFTWQAFVEMADVKQAVNFVRYHQQQMMPALIRGQPVQLQYSATYTELKPGQVRL